jgi:hypothetical protein
MIISLILLPATSAFAGDGSPPPTSMNVIANTIQNVVPQLSVPPQISDPNTRLVLPPCVGDVKNDCIVSVEYSVAGGSWSKGEFIESMPLKNLDWKLVNNKEDFNETDQVVFAKPRPDQNFPAGGKTGLWQLRGAKHLKSDLYAVTIFFAGEVSDRTRPTAPETKILWKNREFKIQIGTYNRDEISNGRVCSGVLGGAYFSCEFINVDKFPSNTKFRIKANFLKTKSILENSPWLIGHLVNTRISTISNNDSSQTLIIEGAPTISAMVEAKFEKTPSSYLTYLKAMEIRTKLYTGDMYPFEYSYQNFLDSQGSDNLSPAEPGVVEAWNLIEKLAPFKYLEEEESWFVHTATVWPSGAQLLDKCNSEKFSSGLLASNAVGTNPRAPSWDPSTKELSYSVASPHLKANGSTNFGFYELSIDQRLAQCLWGKDVLQYKASISVTSLDGEKKISTIGLASRDGFITFRATGFTYSANAIQVKLSSSSNGVALKNDLPDYVFPMEQISKEAPKIEVTPNTPNAVRVNQRTTITCIKGKVSKKVTAVSPKCPTGYKKKP